MDIYRLDFYFYTYSSDEYAIVFVSDSPYYNISNYADQQTDNYSCTTCSIFRTF